MNEIKTEAHDQGQEQLRAEAGARVSRESTHLFYRVSAGGPDGFTTEPITDGMEALKLPVGTLVLVVRTPERRGWKPRAHLARVSEVARAMTLRVVDGWTYRWPEDRTGVKKSIDAWLRGSPRPPGNARKRASKTGPVVSRVTPMLVREPTAIEQEAMTSPAVVARACADLVGRDREVVRVMHLDSRSMLISYEDVSVGIANASLVHPREVFRGAILAGAISIVLVHNHPSGEVIPSQEDKEVTRRLRDVGRTVGITVLDHVIVGSHGRHTALASSGVELP